jgi:transcriptional regulator with XRE-family HTH domain
MSSGTSPTSSAWTCNVGYHGARAVTADYAIGQRVAELRARRGLTQEGLAEAAGLHVNTIKKIERGYTASMESYRALARALDVVTMTFVAPSTPEPMESQDGREMVLADMRAAIVPPIGIDGPIYRHEVDEGEPDLGRLQRAMRSLGKAYADNRYNDVAALAPAVIRSADYHVRGFAGQQRGEAIRVRGDALGLTGRYLIQIRAHDLALIAFHKALADANETGDHLLTASVIGSQAWAMLRQARFSEVEDLCASVADRIEPRMSDASTDALGAWGSLLLNASSAAVRNNRPDAAREYLSLAAAAGSRVGRQADIRYHRFFGPLTVAIQGAQNELIDGRPDKSLEAAEQFSRGDIGSLTPSAWKRHLLDRARALVQLGQGDKAMEILTALRLEAPEWLRQQRHARETTRDILRSRKRTLRGDQRELADFLRLEI